MGRAHLIERLEAGGVIRFEVDHFSVTEIVLDPDGSQVEWYPECKLWCNSQYQIHREGGSAIEWPDGSRAWFNSGFRHREDGPAVISPGPERILKWFCHGIPHRIDGPAIIIDRGIMSQVEYWRDGVLDRSVIGPLEESDRKELEKWCESFVLAL